MKEKKLKTFYIYATLTWAAYKHENIGTKKNFYNVYDDDRQLISRQRECIEVSARSVLTISKACPTHTARKSA